MLFRLVKSKGFPGQLGILAFVQDGGGVAEHRELPEVRLPQLGFADHCLVHPARDDEALQGDAGEDVHRFLIGLAFPEQDAHLAGTAAIDRHIEIADADVLAVAGSALHLQQIAHLLDALVESGRLGVEVQAGLGAVVTVHQADCHRNGEGIAVLEGDGTLETDDVVGQGNMIIRGLHRLLHHPDLFCLLAAEGHLGLVVIDQLVAGAGSADGIHRPLDALLCQFPLPVVGIRDERAILQIDEALGHGQHRDGGVHIGQNFVQEPVYAERGNAADDEVGALHGLFPLLELIILHTLREIPVKLQVTAGRPAAIYDLPVQRGADQTYFIAIFTGGKSQRGTHHSRPDNCDFPFHFYNANNFANIKIIFYICF